MVYNYNGTKVYYHIAGDLSTRPIVLLHGWGRDSSDFDRLIEDSPGRYFVTVDFPPFGKSGEIEGWNLYTYAGMLLSLCEHLNISNADFIGHSFGGRIVLLICALKRSLVHKCILVDSAGMKPRRSIGFKIKLMKYKFYRRMGWKASGGSSDYLKLSPPMKETFKSIVSTPLEPYARRITNKTLIIWGEDDKETPLYMAKRLNKLIKHSKLVVISGGHFSFLDSPLVFQSEIYKFLKE